jgi:hypothetical protein
MTPGKRGGLTVENEAGINGGAWRRAAEVNLAVEDGLPRVKHGAGPLAFDLALGDGSSCAEQGAASVRARRRRSKLGSRWGGTAEVG